MRWALVVCVLGAVPAVASTWVVGPRPHGQVRFKVEGPLDDVIGETRDVSGSVDLDDQDWTKSKALIAVQLGTLKTGIDQRDEDMRVEFLQTARFPFALMAIEHIERPSVATFGPGQEVQGEAVGSFELHGVRRALRIPVTVKRDASGRLTVSGNFEVPFADYNISRPQRLFFKLGDTADASFAVEFVARESAPAPEVAKPEVPVPTAPTVATVLPPAAKAKPRPARKTKAELKTPLLFAGDDAKAKGERLFHSADTGGAGNKLTCGHCHAKADERAGLKQPDGFARAASSLWNSSHRPKFWGGLAPTAGKAASVCQQRFMRGSGLSEQQQGELQAFFDALSPDPAPELDYAAFYRTLESPIKDPLGGDPIKGRAVNETWCEACHLDGRAAPPLAFGLYEPEWLVRRVRWLEGHQNTSACPPTGMTRLTDSDLRNLVTFLANPKFAPPVFTRAKK